MRSETAKWGTVVKSSGAVRTQTATQPAQLLMTRRGIDTVGNVRGFGAVLLAMATAISVPRTTFAQAYPAKTVRLVVPIAAGGGTDIVGRIVAQKLTEALGQQFIVDNRPGAGGIIGSEIVAKSPPDGYVLLFTPTSHAINPSLYTKLPYDTLKDFSPVALVASVTTMFVAHPSLPVRSVRDVVALAKARPHELSFGSAGTGHLFHLTGEMFKTAAGIDMVHVPYKGGAPAIAGLVGGEVSVLFETMLALQPFVQANRVRPLAVASAQRSALLPDIPTLVEAGFPTIVAANWYALYAPASTPKEIAGKLSAEIARTMNTPEMRKRLLAQGTEVVTGSPAELDTFTRSELTKWANAVRISGARID